jgi:hypothetical protein
MKNTFILSFLILSTATVAATETVLKSGGRIVSKTSKQTLTKYCEDQREWLEVEKLPNPKVTEKINQSLKADLKLDQKKQTSDCLHVSDKVAEEAFKAYNGYQTTLLSECKKSKETNVDACEFNHRQKEAPDSKSFRTTATLTDSRKSLIGIEVGIGSIENQEQSHTDYHCSLYSLSTGDKYSLQDELTPEGKVIITTRTCAFLLGTTPSKEERESCQTYEQLQEQIESPLAYCLVKEGVDVRFITLGHERISHKIILTQEEIKKSFRLPDGLDLSL